MPAISKQQEEKIKNALEFMDALANDSTLPRNVRESIVRSRDALLAKGEELDVRVTSAVYALDDITNDVNLPMHARGEIWNLVSALEDIKR